jgi:hypothetical protein
MVSFDVESLFTNTPTAETIEIILNRAFKNNYTHEGLNKPTLKKLLQICTMESHFQFNGKYYDQVDGVAMGRTTFCQHFHDEFENKNMKNLKELGVTNWSRYVDDVFSIIKNKELAQQILDFLNNKHIKFTIEKEKNNKILFLDTEVTRTETGFSAKIYHKLIFTGVYLNRTSLTSRKIRN